jgi:hypothetical protein
MGDEQRACSTDTSACLLSLESGMAQAAYPFFHLGIFGNVDLNALAPSNQNSAFRHGALDLFLTSQLSERWTGLVEVLIETIADTLITDIERYQIAYDHAEWLRLTAGRVHSPLIRWNIAHHHGLFLQTTIDKPAMTRSEDSGGLWPVHYVGALVSGRLSNALGLTYTAGVGNGRGLDAFEVQINNDRNSRKAFLVGLGLVPPDLAGLDIGVTAYFDRVPWTVSPLQEQDLMISASYVAHGIELRGEYGILNFERSDNDEDFDTRGWYVLISKSLPGRLENLRPYAMVDRLERANGLPFIQHVPDQSAWIGGMRYDFNTAVAVKADYRSQRLGSADRDGLVRFQLAFSLN